MQNPSDAELEKAYRRISELENELRRTRPVSERGSPQSESPSRPSEAVPRPGALETIHAPLETEGPVEVQAGLIGQIHDSVVTTDVDGIVTSWNKGAEYLSGRTAQEMIGQPISTVYLEEDRHHLEFDIAALEARGEHEVEVRIVRSSGEVHYTHLSLSPLRNQQGKAFGLIGYSIDITARKKADGRRASVMRELDRRTAELSEANESLSRNARLLRNVIDTSPDLIFVKDTELRTILCNKAFAAAIGREPEDLYGRTDIENGWPPDLVLGNPDEGIRGFVVDDRNALAGNVVRNAEDPALVNGEIRIFDTVKKPLVDSADGVIGILGVARDVTERMRLDQQRASHLRYLEKMARIDRAIQLANDVEQMMTDVLQVTLETLGSDRAWLIYPCDPEAESWGVPMEVTVPDYPGAFALGEALPMSPGVQEAMSGALDKNDVVILDHRVSGPTETSERFNIKTEMFVVVRPRFGEAWLFGVHLCSHHRDWTDEDQMLFRGIGLRIGDALNILLSLRDLRASEEKWRSLTVHSADRIMLLDCDGTIRFLNHPVSGLSAGEMLGTSVYDHAQADFREAMFDCHERVIESQEIGTYETDYDAETGSARHCEVRIAPVLDRGNTVALISSSRDITERKIAERRQKMMMRELDHRVKNNLAVILALAEESRRRATSIDEFTESFRGRLVAIAGTHDALAGSNWEGMDLTLAIRLMLGPHLQGNAPRLSLAGPPVMLPATIATPIGLSLHELATNAAKHGALSNATGSIELRWRVDGDRLRIDWRERNGPEISEPRPAGLGTKLINGFIVHQLGGEVRLDYAPTGFSCEIDVPLPR